MPHRLAAVPARDRGAVLADHEAQFVDLCRMSAKGISSEAYVRRHVELSKEILDRDGKRARSAVS
jgi:hypothetical protein